MIFLRHHKNTLLLAAAIFLMSSFTVDAQPSEITGAEPLVPIDNLESAQPPMPSENDLSAPPSDAQYPNVPPSAEAQPLNAEPLIEQGAPQTAVTSPASPSLDVPAQVVPSPGAAEASSEAGLSPEAVEAIQDTAAEDVFYDADALVPKGEMSGASPRKMDPVVEPASRFIIVRKGAPSDSQTANLVAANRAIKLGRYSSALEIYNKLYDKNPKDPTVLMGRAVALQKMGNIDEAIAAYESVLIVQEQNTEARTNMLGLLSERYPAVAIRQLLDLREKNPENIGVLAQLAVVEARLGNYESAMKYLGVAASMEPNNASHSYNMAIIADQAGLKKDAILYYEQALETDTIYGGNRSIPRESVFTRLAQLR